MASKTGPFRTHRNGKYLGKPRKRLGSFGKNSFFPYASESAVYIDLVFGPYPWCAIEGNSRKPIRVTILLVLAQRTAIIGGDFRAVINRSRIGPDRDAVRIAGDQQGFAAAQQQGH